jgi:hypothetical protein
MHQVARWIVGTESKAQIVSGKLLPLNLVSRRHTEMLVRRQCQRLTA